MHSADALARLDSLANGFRGDYLTYDRIVAQLRSWAEAFPQLAHLRSIGRTHEGRDLWMLTLGPDPNRSRPSVWIDGNMHASEVCGSSVALAIAEDVLRMHLAPDADLHGLPPHVRTRLRDVRFFILPRMCPDGAEAVLGEGRYVRSNPRDRRPDRSRPRWLARDVDGDGAAMLMRKRDPTGEFVEASEFPGLLVPRRLEDPPPYFKIYPEGTIEAFDGRTIPDPYFLSDNDTDLNRNFPFSWTPEPEQEGAGAYPTSEPESRAVVDFVTAHPEIFAWLNLHTFGGVFIRPLGHQPDAKMNPEDLAIFRQIEAWGDAIVGYPTVSGFEEFCYVPEKPLHGDLSDFGYHQRGAIAYVCELWDLFHQLGIPRKKPFVDHYAHITREQMIALAEWDRTVNKGRAIRPWKPFVHPQLGEVEIGGVDSRVGLSNPPYEQLGEVCTKQSAMFLRVAAMAPHVVLARTEVHGVDGDVRRVEVTVENHGYLATCGLASSRALPWNEPVFADAIAEGGCSLVSSGEARREVGHLEGFGRGLFGTDGAIYYQRSRGSVSSKTIEWVVRGRGVLRVRVGSCRVGFVEKAVEV